MTGHPGTCVHPTCPNTATTRNRANQSTCHTHRLVVVTGSWVNDDNTIEGGHG